MKQFFIIFAAICAVFLFAACQNPTGSDVATPTVSGSVAIQTTDGVRYVKNSLWEGCSLAYLTAKSSGRSADATISADDLTAIVETLNEKENDNQYFLSETDKTITDSPLCNIYIAKNVGNITVFSYLDFPRAELADMLERVQHDAIAYGNCSVYVDKVPPYVAPPEDTRTRHEKYHLQMVNKYGKIVVNGGYRYEESCEETYDAFIGTPEGDGPARGWPTVDDYFNCRINAFQTDMMSVGLVPEDKPWTIVSGSIWVEPTEDPETPTASE